MVLVFSGICSKARTKDLMARSSNAEEGKEEEVFCGTFWCCAVQLMKVSPELCTCGDGGGSVGRASDSRSKGRWFDIPSGAQEKFVRFSESKMS